MSVIGGAAATKLPGLALWLSANAIGVAIRRRVPRVEMDALVLAGQWNPGVEAVKSDVVSDLGSAYGEAAWEPGKEEAWSMYRDEVGDSIAWTVPHGTYEEKRR